MSKSDEESSEEVRPTPGGGGEFKESDVVARAQEIVPHKQEFYLDSASSGGFIAYDREDKWNTSYDKRYLDALASVLLISRKDGNMISHKGSDKDGNKVAAITQVNGTYYLAYNDAKNDTFEENYGSKLLELLECLNTRNWLKLLALHILYNRVDFLNILGGKDFQSPEGLLRNAEGFRSVVAKLSTKLAADAGAIEQATSMKKRLESIEKIEGTKSIIEIIKCAFEQIVTIGIDSVCKSYIDLVVLLVPQKVEDRPHELMKLILRPLQNVVKLASYIEKKLPELELKLGENLTFLDNNLRKIGDPDNGVEVHAEVRVAHFLKQLPAVKEVYIGVSRLCCAGCHKVLDDSGYEHRGTSGMFFPDWKYSLGTKEILQQEAVPSTKKDYDKRRKEMQRDLSEDPDYEKTVIQGVNLVEIKKGLAISKTYTRLREGEEQKDKCEEDVIAAFMGIGDYDVPASGESAKPPESGE